MLGMVRHGRNRLPIECVADLAYWVHRCRAARSSSIAASASPKFSVQHEYDGALQLKRDEHPASEAESQLKGWVDTVIGRTKQWPIGLK